MLRGCETHWGEGVKDPRGPQQLPQVLLRGEEASLDQSLVPRMGRPRLVQPQKDGENQAMLPGLMLLEASGKPGS